MIEVQPWMRRAVGLLTAQFGQRLLFVGLQGSYCRGEAGGDSDIDIMVILDTMDLADLKAYRALLNKLPEGEKAGGFTCGRQELLAWPRFELFQFARDTDAYYGNLQALLPPVSRADIITGAQAGVSGLRHMATHLFISSDLSTRIEALAGLYKGFFFSMQMVEYLRSGVYARSKKELLARLRGAEAELLRLSMDSGYFNDRKDKGPEMLFQLLLTWTGSALLELAATP